jgi:hypothetical protein
MIVVIGLVILFVAVMVAVTGRLTDAGGTHDSFAVLGYHVTGSTGTSFLFGIVVGAGVLLSLSLLLTGARRNAGHERPESGPAARSLVAPSSTGRHRRTGMVPGRSGGPRSLPSTPRWRSVITDPSEGTPR